MSDPVVVGDPTAAVVDDLVFTTRLDLLRRNLDLVTGVYTLIGARFLVDRPVVAPTRDLLPPTVNVQSCALAVQQAVLKSDQHLLRASVNALIGAVTDLFREVAEVPESTPPFTQPGELDEQLADTARRLQGRATQLATSTADPGAKWRDLRRLEAEANDVFSEYVDLVRGVALRSAGMDGDLCTIADRLVRVVSDGWKSLTIPARTERQNASAGFLIRIGFPEWTAWTVPLAGHEYGHVFNRTRSADTPRLAALVGTPEQSADTTTRVMRILAADAFAALTAGPCYACALFTSRLDPGRTDELTARRAEVVLAALERAAGKGQAAAFVGQLRHMWDVAIVACGGVAATRQDIDDELIAAVAEQLAGQGFPFDEWLSVVDPIAGQLAGGDADAVTLPSTSDVRHVLNAAWLARLDGRATPAILEGVTRKVCLEKISRTGAAKPATSSGSNEGGQ